MSLISLGTLDDGSKWNLSFALNCALSLPSNLKDNKKCWVIFVIHLSVELMRSDGRREEM
jgi:hypothetical protein